ncbi:hypothetical protein AVEN_48795-1 [Araneus ventricosus]|uniref:Uncharacterized protein n=1 Tax=Araneus ventricosus TaxID=182803 RepID=A0A4Y2IG00_ARAVE|nr:hypothetical protein AVEN_48795-1 [Araneus ventricosus]
MAIQNSNLPPSFVNEVVKIVEDETIVRSNLKSVSDVYSWIKEYGRTLNKIRMSHYWCDVQKSDVKFTCPIRALQSYNGALFEYRMPICAPGGVIFIKIGGKLQNGRVMFAFY